MHSFVKPTHSTYTFAESPWKQLSVQKFPKTWNWLDLILLLCIESLKIFRQQKNSSNEMIQFDQWRQTLIYIGGALNNNFHSLWIIGGAKSYFI